MVIILKKEVMNLRSNGHKRNCRGEKQGLDCCKFITHVRQSQKNTPNNNKNPFIFFGNSDDITD